MKTHGDFVRYLKANNPELLAAWEQALKEFYFEEVEQ